jgi:hypothetical protein
LWVILHVQQRFSATLKVQAQPTQSSWQGNQLQQAARAPYKAMIPRHLDVGSFWPEENKHCNHDISSELCPDPNHHGKLCCTAMKPLTPNWLPTACQALSQ